MNLITFTIQIVTDHVLLLRSSITLTIFPSNSIRTASKYSSPACLILPLSKTNDNGRSIGGNQRAVTSVTKRCQGEGGLPKKKGKVVASMIVCQKGRSDDFSDGDGILNPPPTQHKHPSICIWKMEGGITYFLHALKFILFNTTCSHESLKPPSPREKRHLISILIPLQSLAAMSLGKILAAKFPFFIFFYLPVFLCVREGDINI